MEDKMKIPAQEKVYIRYIVNDVKECVDYYTQFLGFNVKMQPPGNGFAMLESGNLYLILNTPGQGGAGQTLSDGSVPASGGWNRIQIRVNDLEEKIKELESKKVLFRNGMIKGNGGAQILLADPSGNLIELFESYR
jgi:catechol 2,3-dioxygenase-like lactoylglutathione lyase family enzyme